MHRQPGARRPRWAVRAVNWVWDRAGIIPAVELAAHTRVDPSWGSRPLLKAGFRRMWGGCYTSAETLQSSKCFFLAAHEL